MHEITLVTPFPAGEERSASAGGGIGGKKKANGRVGRRQGRQAPPPGTAAVRLAGDQPGKPPGT